MMAEKKPEDIKKVDSEIELGDNELLSRRDFMVGLKKWSKAVIGGAIAAGALAQADKASAASWVNRRGGWGNSWGNGGVGWVNRHGGYGWGNRGGSWGNGGRSWANHGGGGWANGSQGGWANRRGGLGWVNRY
jgi:hypothetical protein